MLQFANAPVDEALEAVHRRLNNENGQICHQYKWWESLFTGLGLTQNGVKCFFQPFSV